MVTKLIAITALVATSVAMVQGQDQSRDKDLRWRLPLQEKETVIQTDISARHLVEGTYVPTVPIPSDGSPVDHSTTGITGDMHASSWTGCYLAALSFRYGWAKEKGTAADVETALELCGQALNGLDILTHITGIPGLLVRKVVHGHGPAVEERIRDRNSVNARDEWHQGVGEYRDLRYRGHPSHHNYHHVLRGLSIWYYFLQKDNPNPSSAEKEQMEKVELIVKEMMEYGYKAHDLTLMTVDGRVSTHLVWGIPEGQPSTRALMATNCLKFAHWITRDEWDKEKYDECVALYGYRKAGDWPPEKWQGYYGESEAPDHDDTEHTLSSLWLVHKLEEDPKLKESYRMAVSSIFESKKNEMRSPFNYFFASVTGEEENADLSGALETLQLYPSVTLTYPFKHSIRSDIETTSTRYGKGTKGVLPFNEQPLDNAYDWKGNPYQLDRWESREITSLAISDEDPMVWFLADSEGTLYQSLDGGETFRVADYHREGRVRQVTYAGNKSRIVLLATDRGIYRTETGGHQNDWRHVAVGPSNEATGVLTDSEDPNVVWAIMRDGVYRSIDLGRNEIGKAWEPVSGPMPTDEEIVYGMSTGVEPMIYATIGGRVYRRGLRDLGWNMSPIDAEDYHILPSFLDVEISPHDPKTGFLLLNLNVWGRDWPLVLRTSDGGNSLKVVGWKLPRPYLPSEGSGLEWSRIVNLTIDPQDPNTIYAASPRGVYRSTDGGSVWQLSRKGLRIPSVFAVFAPKQTPGKIYCTSPAGLHVSEDSGETWGDPILVLNGPGVNRVERGGLGFLMGYWPGRYFGYITDTQARLSPDKW